MNDGEIALLQIHYGEREGQAFIVCGICKSKSRADTADGGALMALGRHIGAHMFDAETYAAPLSGTCESHERTAL